MIIYIPQQVTKTVYKRLTAQQAIVVEKLIVNGQITLREMVDLNIKSPSSVISSLRKMGLEIITVTPTFTIDADGYEQYISPLTYTADGDELWEEISYE